jgi:hypothetical protein
VGAGQLIGALADEVRLAIVLGHEAIGEAARPLRSLPDGLPCHP